jgi:Tfp pilus assembly protein PilN
LWAKDRINFLPYRDARARQLRRARLTKFVLAAGMGMLCALGGGEWQRFHTARLDARSTALEAALQQLEPSLAEMRTIERGLQAYTKRMALISQLSQSRWQAFELLAALGTAPSTGVVLVDLHDRVGRVIATGRTSGEHAVSAWTRRLKNIPAFSSVEIADIQRRSLAATSGAAGKETAFSVRMQLNGKVFAAMTSVPIKEKQE